MSKPLVPLVKPYVFVDIDGVLNCFLSEGSHEKAKALWAAASPPGPIFPELLSLLRGFIEDVDASVVISSTWRKINTRSTMVGHLGDWLEPRLDPAWKTGNAQTGFRGDEVEMWMKEEFDNVVGQRPAYVIFDDDGDFHGGQPLIKVDGMHGLRPADTVKARMLLVNQGWRPRGLTKQK